MSRVHPDFGVEHIPSTGHASLLRRCSRVVSISLRNLLARMPVCDVYAHTDGFAFDPKD